MKMPFSTEQFMGVFRDYNEALFPAQIVLFAVAILIVYLAITKQKEAGRIISWCLAFLWAWMGIVYHIAFFTQINPAAYFFGGLFIVQGALFFRERRRLAFHINLGSNWVTPLIWIYALAVYPIVGFNAGHVYPYTPTFGLPCPTTIFTFGTLLLTDGKVSWKLIIIPTFWSLVGATAAVQFGMFEDVGLLVAAAATIIVLGLQKRANMTQQKMA